MSELQIIDSTQPPSCIHHWLLSEPASGVVLGRCLRCNATTPGYSRQRVDLAAMPGGGVDVVDTQRVRDLFLDFQIRGTNSSLGDQSARSESLQRVELALNEPGDTGLRAVLGRFFNAWRDLSNNPESSSTRTAVLQAGASVAVTAQRLYASFTDLRAESDVRVRQDVAEINGITTRVANLNEQIARLQVTGDDASDLRDQRDQSMDRLATLVGVQYQNRDDGRVDVFLGGHALVQGSNSFALTAVNDAGNSNYARLEFADATVARVDSGEIAGLVYQRDTDLPDRLADLHTMVGAIIADVNTAHAAAYGRDGVNARNFFSGTDASDIGIDPAVDGNPNAVAASSTAAGVPGNGDGAASISDLQYARGLLGNTSSYDEYWASFISNVGTASSEAQSLEHSQQVVVEHIDQLRQATSGVNMDEEMVQLMAYQRAYEAAARLVQVVDGMLDTLINRMA